MSVLLRHRYQLFTEPDDLGGALLGALAAGDALVIVNMRHVVGEGDSPLLALAGAEATADAARVADLLHNRPLVLVAALDSVFRLIGHDLNQVLRAGGHALAASHALGAVYFRHAVDDLDGVKLTGVDTAA